MNRTGRAPRLDLYPLVSQSYELVRAIDSLPASIKATNLVTQAGELMDEIWNYYEEGK